MSLDEMSFIGRGYVPHFILTEENLHLYIGQRWRKRFFRGNIVDRGVSHIISLDEMDFTRGGMLSFFFNSFVETKRPWDKTLSNVLFSFTEWKWSNFHGINSYQTCPFCLEKTLIRGNVVKHSPLIYSTVFIKWMATKHVRSFIS